MNQVIALQHAEPEELGLIARALEASGYSLTPVRTFLGERVPEEMENNSGLVIMGGPMGVYEYDRFPFLRSELRLIESALREAKPVLGVCLGSQLLASALGANIKKGKRKEIGWREVTLSEAAQKDALLQGIERVFIPCHWHGDVFELPRAATQLASSELTACQAFRYSGSAYGFLFHMEMTPGILRNMTETFADELAEEGLRSDDILREGVENLTRIEAIGTRIFGRWVKMLPAAG
ncbi:MAG: gamma-glutamyl-gamma-aminobutyrate hydrolase family protein [Acidobacteriota bacterium]|nr:gamma-glutamyl-gamma-aminobutyrate hydrolase family protein [Acidobacteriota bacterium]